MAPVDQKTIFVGPVEAAEAEADCLLASSSELEVPQVSRGPRGWRLTNVGAVALGLATTMLLGLAVMKARNPCSNGLLATGNVPEEKLAVNAENQMRAVTRKLNEITSKSEADEMVSRAMMAAGKEQKAKWQKRHLATLPAVFQEIQQYKNNKTAADTALNLQRAGRAQCIFNVMEATTATFALGDDINAMIRVCPAPRGPESELACQVDAGILVAYIGLIAAKLSLAAANCAESTEGLGNGIQCMVDVEFVLENIANMGLAINGAANAPSCKKKSLDSKLNKKTGLPSALCTVDIGGAIAYFGQVITFIQLAIVHCMDFLDVHALCGAGISGIITSAAAIAPYGAAVHAACRYNKLAKSPEEQAAFDGAASGFRRLSDHALTDIAAFGPHWNLTSIPKSDLHAGPSHADVKQLLHLMEPALGEEASTFASLLDQKTICVGPVEAAEAEADCLLASSSELEVPQVSRGPRGWRLTNVGAVALGLATTMLLGLAVMKARNPCSNGLLATGNVPEEKLAVNAENQMRAVTRKLNEITSKSEADEMVSRAMMAAGKEQKAKWQKRHLATLPAVFQEIQQYKNNKTAADTALNLQRAGRAQCIFNVMEATTATFALGDDINAMIRVCPAPRGPESELACQVDAGILVAYIGLIAAKLSLAAANCAESTEVTQKIDSICAAGVSGLVSALGELSGLGNGIQCMVDVEFVLENIANMGLAINGAANAPSCKKKSLDSKLNKKTGLPSALCTVDIGGAIAYFGQVITFIQLAIVHCMDFLDVHALCGAGISGIITSAAAIAPHGAAVHAACRYNKLAKSPEEQAAFDGADSGFRRLSDHALTDIAAFGPHWNLTSIPTSDLHAGPSHADVKQLLHLMEPAVGEEASTSASLRGGWPFQQPQCQ
ncbi:unnamed protein product [Polarella glacialis]|uniref:Uncharacterized protein n=1 Tax=Polarella glacialis TaxID=89957 RepID=A0A813JAU7_POLGL|nr:unnamed protein product [Polarella glacialis]